MKLRKPFVHFSPPCAKDRHANSKRCEIGELKMNKFTVGQPVDCAMYPGAFVVDGIASWSVPNHTFFRYTIRSGEEYHSDIPEVWLTALRIKKPQLRLVAA